MTEIHLTPGDPQGIGPEITEKAIQSHPFSGLCFYIYSRKKNFSKKFQNSKNINWIEPSQGLPGQESFDALSLASLAASKKPSLRALVTGPISKEHWAQAKIPYRGHTDFLSAFTKKPLTMVLASDVFRVALVTDHCAIQSVSKLITKNRIEQVLSHVIEHLSFDKNKKKSIAVLGLNPHAGEAGLLGREEEKIIKPTLNKIIRKHQSLIIRGPLSADSYFGQQLSLPRRQRDDFVVAQYHDQGLIPVKMTGFHSGVNFTLGCPFVRTSVDHGTAFDLFGKNQAHPESMIHAIRLAHQFVKERQKV